MGEASMFTRTPRSGFALAILLLGTLISGCGGGSGSSGEQPTSQQPPVPPPPPPPPPVVVASVSVTPENVEMAALGQTAQLTATALQANGQAVPDAVIRWSSSNPAALEVSDTGLVTARANGTATITAATTGAASAEVTDTSAGRVEQIAVSLSISPESWPEEEVWIGARRQFTADVRDANDHAVEGAEVAWSIDNSRIAVDETGLATAMGSGTATIAATVGDVSDSVGVTIDWEGSSGPGYMYTVWMARTDDAPALIVDGKLRLPELESTHGDVAAVGGEFVAPWSHDTVEKFQYEGNRIGLLTDVANGVGTFRVLDRAREWSRLALGSARDFQLENNRIAVLLEGGRFRVKDGTQGTWWDLAASGAKAFQLENNRIAVQLEDGRLRVKDGLSGTWALIDSTDAAAFQLEGNRIGVLRANGEFRVKDGLNGAVTTLAAGGARKFQLEGNRIALLTDDGQFRVKDGINGAWTLLASEPIRQFELNDNRIGILFESGEFRTKNGIHGAWTVHATEGVQSFQLQAHLIGMLMNDGQLRVRNVSNAATSATPAYGAGVTQYRLVVGNPLPPHRTTPTSYSEGQSRCRGMSGDPDCYPVTGFALPAPYYGIFCGLGRPTGSDFWGTVGGKAPIDGLDQMCVHHDMKAYWYAGHHDTEGEWDATCIVRYGLEYGRLTRNGAVIAHGDSSWDEWDAAWEGASMRNLWDGLNNYWTATNVCSDSMLTQFDAATDAQP